MNIKPRPEKTKPFRLVKYFTLISIVVMFTGAIILSVLNTHWARAMQYQKSEDYALLLAENLNHQIFIQFLLPVGIKFGKIELSNKDQFERMDKVVKSTLHSFQVDMVNIYGMKDIIAYSFNKELIGLENAGGSSYKKALSGKFTSKLIQNGNFFEILFGFPKEIRIITFAPLRAEKPLSRISGPVLGVIEIIQDLSADYQSIFKFQVMVVTTITLVMSFLIIVLILVVKRGEGIIQKRALERLRLKEQLSQAKHLSTLGEMVAVVSHEIRNPLGIISSSAELLTKKIKQDPSSNKIAKIIMEESNRLNNIITDFLNYARPQSPTLGNCQIKEIIKKIRLFLAVHLEDEGYRITTFFSDPLPDIMADSNMLYQAFLNIIINAVQAMPGGGEIYISVQSIEDYILIMIEDQGHGITRQVMEKIWDPFFTSKDTGTGLGLVIIKNIIEAHKGIIKIENRLNKGVRVSIKLPISHED